jgi:CheY-like chemotaxis protein
MAKTTHPKTVVIVDDEMFHLRWLVEYLDDQGYTVIGAVNANEAVNIVAKNIYRTLIIDLNIPVLGPLKDAFARKGLTYSRFPGVYVAEVARNKGYRGRQVVLYSVHKEDSVIEIAKRLSCEYLLKGRPRALKKEIDAILSFDPTLNHQ